MYTKLILKLLASVLMCNHIVIYLYYNNLYSREGAVNSFSVTVVAVTVGFCCDARN